MNAESRGRAALVLAIGAALFLQLLGSFIELRGSLDLNRDRLFHQIFGIAIPQPASFFRVALNFVVVLALSWALYTGYGWARWLWVFQYGFILAVLGFVAPSFLLAVDRGSMLILLLAGAATLCFVVPLLPSTRLFLRGKRAGS